MRTHRFYTPIPLEINTKVELQSEAAHHCINVLRYKVNDSLTVFNGDGFDYLATISNILKKQCTVIISQKINPANESQLAIHLIQGIARGEKMDFIIQKSIELGVAEITPFFTERCNVRLDGKRLDKKLLHWNKTIISACEQSGRARVPRLNRPKKICELSKNNLSVYLHPSTDKRFTDLPINQNINLLIGPEGGFSDQDIAQFKAANFKSVTIGPRVLRTETAGLSAISILQNLYGDI